VRIVAVTNADLASEVHAGAFRADLYARLAGAVVRLRSLRARRAYIPRSSAATSPRSILRARRVSRRA
jgi:DNA-binding NtrC family response regulator